MDLLLMRDANRSDALSMLLDSDKIAQHPAVQYQHIKVWWWWLLRWKCKQPVWY